jgi:hypothetical protein
MDLLGRLLPALLLATGGFVTAALGTLLSFGDVRAESRDPSQTARVLVSNAPPWARAMQLGGLAAVLLGAALVVVAVWRRGRE